MVIRKAVGADIEFLVETIVRAEKGNSETLSYCSLFNISEAELRAALYSILKMNVQGYEFSLSDFWVAETNGKCVAAYCGWIEGLSGISSGLLKASAFRSVLPKSKLEYYKTQAQIAAEIGFKRKSGSIQIEFVYITEKYRGKGVMHLLIDSIIADLAHYMPELEIIQVQLLKQNVPSLRAHLNYGFRIVDEKTSNNPLIQKYYSGNTKVLLEKIITNGNNSITN